MARCKCGAECAHHEPGECPNPMVPPVDVIMDPPTKARAPNSELGMCQRCWDNYYATMEETQA